MKVSVLACAAVFGLALAGCTSPQQQASRPAADTGSMAFPKPQPQGDIGSTSTSARQPGDTGNMAYPAPQPQGDVGSTAVPQRRRPSDTGSMAFPRPLPQGNVGSTQVQ